MAGKKSTQKPTPGTFDISTRRMAPFIEVTLLDPKFPGKNIDTGARIKVYSPQSKEAVRAARQAARLLTVEGDKVTSNEEDLFDNIFEQTIGATFEWNLTDRGVLIPCTPETVRKIYTDLETRWIQGQVQRKYLDLSGFFVDAKTA